MSIRTAPPEPYEGFKLDRGFRHTRGKRVARQQFNHGTLTRPLCTLLFAAPHATERAIRSQNLGCFRPRTCRPVRGSHSTHGLSTMPHL